MLCWGIAEWGGDCRAIEDLREVPCKFVDHLVNVRDVDVFSTTHQIRNDVPSLKLT